MSADPRDVILNTWVDFISYFVGGFFLANAIPHFVAGMMGQALQSPFAKPPGKGLSSSVVNVVWGFSNIVIGYLLVVRVGNFDLHSTADVAPFGVGAFLCALMLAWNFGQYHGGRNPK